MIFKIKILIILGIVVFAGLAVKHHQDNIAQTVQRTASAAKSVATKELASHCKDNISGQEVVVSISKQHMWACNGPIVAYDAPVTTGMELYPEDLTPPGTYHIYQKQINQTLAGSDSTGSWSDFVNYWIPFLQNQYGTYGFHDLTQTDNGANGRPEGDFGKVDINAPYTAAKHGSHGCIELPIAAAKWLYNWSSVGTTVNIVN